MLSIFDDEWRETARNWANPYGTRPLSPLDVVANGLKWPAHQRHWRLARNKMGRAGAPILIVHKP
jgi:hypothetical protein